MMFVRLFIYYASGTNLVSLVPEGYVAIVKPLKYLTFMKRRRVIQMVLTSWGIPFLFSLTIVSFTLSAIDLARTMHGYLYLLFGVILCVILIFFLHPCFLSFIIEITIQLSNCSLIKWSPELKLRTRRQR